MKGFLITILTLLVVVVNAQTYQVVIQATNATGVAYDTIQITLAASPQPVIESIEVGDVSATEVVIKFTSNLDNNSVPAAGDFDFKIDGVSATVSNVVSSTQFITFDIGTSVTAFDELTLDYTQGSNTIRGPFNRVDVPYTGTFTGTNLVYSAYQVGGAALPAGLTFNASNQTFSWNGGVNSLPGFTGRGVTNSLDATTMVANLPDTPPTWLENGYLDVFDTLSAAGVTSHWEYFIDTKNSTEPNSKEDMIGGVTATEVNTPSWFNYKGFLTNTTGALDLNYQKSGGSENASYMVKYTPFTNNTNENYIMGAESATSRVFLKRDTDNNNQVASVHDTGLLGDIFSTDTADITIFHRAANDSLRLYKNDSTAKTKLVTHVGIPAQDIYYGGNNNQGTFENGASIRTGYLAIGDTTIVGAKAIAIKRALFKLDSIKAYNTPVTDTEAPTAPVMAAATSITATSAQLNIGTRGTDNVSLFEVDWFTIERGYEGTTTDDDLVIGGLSNNTTYNFYAQERDEAGNSSPNSDTLSFTTLASGGAIFSDDFEGVDPLGNGPYLLQGAGTQTVITDPTDGGNKVLQLSLPIPSGCPSNCGTYSNSQTRADVQKQGDSNIPFNLALGQAYTFKYRLYYPSSWTFQVSGAAGQMTLHSPNGINPMNGSPINLRIDGNQFSIKAAEQPVYQGTAANKIDHNQDNIFTVTKSTWIYVTIQFKQRRWVGADTESYLRVYINNGSWPDSGDLVYDVGTGTSDNIGYNEDEGGFLKPATNYFHKWQDADDVLLDYNAGVTVGQTHYVDDISIQEGTVF